MKRKFGIIIAIFAIIGLLFASCDDLTGKKGPQGEKGDNGLPGAAPELVVDLATDDGEYDFILNVGETVTLTAVVNGNALVQTTVWEFFDSASSEILRLDRPPEEA